jgi:hypothetical protein
MLCVMYAFTTNSSHWGTTQNCEFLDTRLVNIHNTHSDAQDPTYDPKRVENTLHLTPLGVVCA